MSGGKHMKNNVSGSRSTTRDSLYASPPSKQVGNPPDYTPQAPKKLQIRGCNTAALVYRTLESGVSLEFGAWSLELHFVPSFPLRFVNATNTSSSDGAMGRMSVW